MLWQKLMLCGGIAAISKTANAVNETNLTTFTFSSQALGAAAGDRKIVVAVRAFVTGATGRTLDSVTVGGVSASQVVTNTGTSGTDDNYAAIWQADVPTGTTGDVVLTFSGQMNGAGIGVYRVTGALSAAHDTGGSSASPGSDTLNIPAGGVAVGCAGGNAASGVTWTNLTEDYDEDIEASPTIARQTGASQAFAAQQTALSITATYAGTPTYRAMSIASWGPA